MNRECPGRAVDAQATRMFQEASETPSRVATQLDQHRDIAISLARSLRRAKPRTVVTVARGSSDHAATYARYLIETKLGILTSSLAPSVSSIYAASVGFADTICLAISQSGRSPDLIKAVETAKHGGARVVAFIESRSSTGKVLLEK